MNSVHLALHQHLVIMGIHHLIMLAWMCITGGAMLAQPIVLDPFFGTSGLVVIDTDTCYEPMTTLAVDADQRILVGGYQMCAPDRPLLLHRFLPSGEPDITFGLQGLAMADIGEQYAECTGLAVLPDGGVLMTAGYGPYGFNPMALVRFRSDGLLDTTFGQGGIRKILEFPESWPLDVAIQDDGRIVVAGLHNYRVAVFRFHADGTPDNTFADIGMFTHPIIGNWCWGSRLALLADGRIVITGSGGPSGNYDVFVARLLPNGQFDPSFGTGGRRVVSFSSGDDLASGMVVLGDGSILVAGSRSGHPNYDAVVAKFNPQGNLDQTFGTGGISAFSASLFTDRAQDIGVLPDGRMLVAGRTTPGTGQSDLMLARLTPNGALDETLNGNGFLISDVLGGSYDLAIRMAMLPNEKVLLLGRAGPHSTLLQYLLSPVNGMEDRPQEGSAPTVVTDPGAGAMELLFTLSGAARVRYDLRAVDGRSIRSLTEAGTLPAGTHRSRFDMGGLASGVYLVSVYDEEAVRSVRFVWP